MELQCTGIEILSSIQREWALQGGDSTVSEYLAVMPGNRTGDEGRNALFGNIRREHGESAAELS